jgi:hypothetical protein
VFNNNRCPLCRQELFEQEDFGEDGAPRFGVSDSEVDDEEYDSIAGSDEEPEIADDDDEEEDYDFIGPCEGPLDIVDHGDEEEEYEFIATSDEEPESMLPSPTQPRHGEFDFFADDDGEPIIVHDDAGEFDLEETSDQEPEIVNNDDEEEEHDVVEQTQGEHEAQMRRIEQRAHAPRRQQTAGVPSNLSGMRKRRLPRMSAPSQPSRRTRANTSAAVVPTTVTETRSSDRPAKRRRLHRAVWEEPSSSDEPSVASAESEYEPDDDDADAEGEREEQRVYRLLPSEGPRGSKRLRSE